MVLAASFSSGFALTNPSLIALAAVVCGVLIAVTLVIWRRAAQPGTRQVLGRFGLLLANYAAVTSLIFLSVNRVFGFYASWAELIGTSSSTGVVRAAPADTASPSPAPGGANGNQAGPPAPLGTGSPQPDGQAAATSGRTVNVLSSQSLVTAAGRDAGELQRVRVYGQRSGLSANGYVYLPPQYAPPAQPGHQLAVVVVISDTISGSGSATPSATRSGTRSGTRSATRSDGGAAADLALTAYGQVAAGRAAPAIYVMLPATVAPGDQGCLDVPGGPQAGTFFSQDIPAAVRTAYRGPAGPAGWGLLGDSSGGYCAVQLAMTRSDRFAVAAAPAAGYQVPPGIPAGPAGTAGQQDGSQARPTPRPWLFGGSPLLQQEDNLLWRLRNRQPQPVTVTFTGSSSAELAPARAFLSAVRPPMKAGTVTEAPGAQPFAPVVDRVTRELSTWG